ncbi:IPT/TIG domain-containing protein [Actinoplanes italicus]|uniref:IPT/TIG domain-containing protein n=2 Tax=Actinoplanes italicus TaxID=113567 RepID=A0A2T0K6P6_9ACTN|nr:IPT/TIG domain-containing protein [Actinoplanes italicus]
MVRGCGRIGMVTAAAAVVVLSGTSAPAMAASGMTLSSTTGPSGGGATITGTVSAGGPFVPGSMPTVQFQYIGTGSSTCAARPKEIAQIAVTDTTATAGVLTVRPEAVKRLSTTKIAFEVPSSAYPDLDGDGNPSQINPTGLVLAGTQTSARWNVCVYDSDSLDSGNLLAMSTYTVVPRPSITGVVPASGSAVGGQLITVTGTGFSSTGSGVSGSIGGADLTSITVAPNGNSFTAMTGPRAADSGLALTVNTPGGTVSSLDPDNNGQPEDGDPATIDAPIPFTYSNGIRILPNTAPVGAKVDVDVIGAGFSDLTFVEGGSPTDSNAHVFLVKDVYVPGSNRGVAECTDVVIVNDTELVCTLDLGADQLSPVTSLTVPNTPIAEGAYVLTVVANGDLAVSDSVAKPTIVSSGAVFAVSPY